MAKTPLDRRVLTFPPSNQDLEPRNLGNHYSRGRYRSTRHSASSTAVVRGQKVREILS